jgi:DNA-binding transcriptional ArsR family regulator
MSTKFDNPYNALKRIFHEPSRLAIMSALCRSSSGLSFNQLKIECVLTDGNLSSHLKMLEESSVISIEKTFKGSKPLTTIVLTDSGRENFIYYLEALEEVLMKAAEAVGSEDEGIPLYVLRLKPASV